MSNNIVDKPSLHWSKSYLKKVWKISNKNSKYNFSGKLSTYNKVPNYFYLDWKQFLPCFIGWCFSLYNASYAYGLIRSSTIFNIDLYKVFKKRVFISIATHYLFGPVFIFLVLFLTPLINVEWSVFSSTWGSLTKTNIATFISDFSTNIVKPYFNGSGWWVSLIILSFGSCFNFSSIISYLIINRKNDDYMRLIFLENELKMKLSNFKKR